MPETRIGTCSLCGGDVMGWTGGWWSIKPPPPDRCSSCGAVRAGEVIDMVRAPKRTEVVTTDGTNLAAALGEEGK